MPPFFPLWVVITHFLVFFLLLLARSGLEVLSAFPKPYWYTTVHRDGSGPGAPTCTSRSRPTLRANPSNARRSSPTSWRRTQLYPGLGARRRMGRCTAPRGPGTGRCDDHRSSGSGCGGGFLPHVLRDYALLADGERGALIGPRGGHRVDVRAAVGLRGRATRGAGRSAWRQLRDRAGRWGRGSRSARAGGLQPHLVRGTGRSGLPHPHAGLALRAQPRGQAAVPRPVQQDKPGHVIGPHRQHGVCRSSLSSISSCGSPSRFRA